EILQPLENGGVRDAPKVVALQARQDRLRHLLRLGRREDKLDVRRRLLERLQQRVEGLIGQLMGLVDNVNLEAVARRTVAQIFDYRARVIDLAVSGAVDLTHVERAAAADLDARGTLAARLGGRTLLAIEAARENSCGRGLADAANPGEQKRVRYSVALQRFAERARHVLLAHQLREALRSPFARKYEMCGWGFGHREIFSHGTARRMIARHPCGTGCQPVPLLPSGPGGVRGLPLRRTRLSAAGSPDKLLQRAFLLRALLEYHSAAHATADDENVSCPM